jgi:hypothetical protein
MEIQRIAGTLPVVSQTRAERRALARAQGAALSMQLGAQLEQARIHTIANVTEYGMFRVTQLKKMQNELESSCPDVAESLAMLANHAVLDIARSLHQFGQGVA